MVNEYLDIIGLGIFKALNDKRYPILVNGKISESAIPTSITNSITSILSLIPDAASSENKLADKNFVNSSIATNTATFRGTFDDLATLQATSADINDYAFYVHTDEIGNTAYDRYKHNGSTWVFEYTLNNSSFTAEQWSAINSGITTTKVGNYDAHLINYSNPHKVTKSQVGLGLVENVAISTWKGSENITTLGTITKGTWKGTKIGNDYLANSSITIGTTAISLGSTAKSLAGIEKLQLNDAKSNLVYDSTTGSWKLTGNLLVTGFISAGAKGTSGGGSSTYTQKEWAQIKGMTESASGILASAYAVKEAYNELNTAIETLAGKATNVTFAQTLTSGKQIGSISIDGKSTSLFAPANYAWSEVTGKPSFATVATSGSYADLSNKPTIASLMGSAAIGGTSSYLYWNGSAFVSKALGSNAFTSISKVSQLTNDSGYITGITKAMVEGVLTGNITSHTHSYLPLAGGTMSNTNVVTNLNADLLDGYDITSVVSARYGGDTLDLNEISIPSIYRLRANNPNLPSGFYDSNILTVKIPNNDTAWQLLGVYSSDKLLYRRGTWFADGRGTLRTNAWKEIAFTDSNVASSSQSLLLSNTSDAKAVSGVFFHRDYNVTSLVGNTEGNGVWGHPSDSQDANYGNASILRIGWDSSYYTDIFTGPNLASGKYGLQWRQIINRTAKDWRTILDSSNFNSYAPKLDGTGASGTWGINISGNAATATDADTLDGVHYQNILERYYSGYASSGTATGWFRIAETLINNGAGITFLLAIQRSFSHANNESYLFSISISYWGGISITQLSGYANTRLITKIRVDWANGQIAYVDLYIDSSTTNNNYYWYTVGCAKSYTAWTANATLNGTAYEFTTVNGCKSDRGFTGNIAGNATSATKLATPRTITLTGSVTGSVSIDGSQNVSLATTTNHTHNYLPLSGGTLSGHLIMASPARIKMNGGIFEFNDSSGSTQKMLWAGIDPSTLSIWSNSNWYSILHSGNYNSYAPKLDGTGASGTWGISISGNAATATNLTSTTVIPFNSTSSKYRKFASINITNRYAGKQALLLLNISLTAASRGNSCKVYVMAYQQNALGNPPYYSIETDCDNRNFEVYAVLNYTSTTSTIELYAYGKGLNYHSLTISLLSGANIIDIGSDILSSLPSGTVITPTKYGSVYSATKLATSRTIWGQSFDGTGNVSGALSGVTNINSALYIDSSGNVSIGTTTPSYNLHIVGTAYASEGLVSDGYISSAATSTSSDIRLKDNISEISSEMALKWLSMLKPKSWTWNSLAGIKGRSMGFVAQDVEGILPQMIRNRHDNGYLSLDYTQLHAIEVSALQSHEKRIEELERENKILKEELNKLKLNAN